MCLHSFLACQRNQKLLNIPAEERNVDAELELQRLCMDILVRLRVQKRVIEYNDDNHGTYHCVVLQEH
jgi:hypothetical protein